MAINDWILGLGQPQLPQLPTTQPGFMGRIDSVLRGGLLGDEGDAMRMQSLLGLGAGMLNASGPSTTPVSLGQVFGQGIQGMQRAQQGTLQNMMTSRQMNAKQAPTVREFSEGNEIVTKQLGPDGKWQEISRAPRWNPNQALGRDSYFTPIYTADGVLAFNNRAGSAAPVMVGGKAVIGASTDPTLQGNLSKSKKIGDIAGETEAISTIKKPQQARETLSMLDEADKLIDQSTGSMVGAGRDVLAGAVGISTEGAKASAKLKVLQAGLMTNMPRMEGPQSDRDVQLYREAAGQIGDPMTPNENKKAALQVIRTLQQRYASRAPQAGATAAPADNDPLGLRR